MNIELSFPHRELGAWAGGERGVAWGCSIHLVMLVEEWGGKGLAFVVQTLLTETVLKHSWWPYKQGPASQAEPTQGLGLSDSNRFCSGLHTAGWRGMAPSGVLGELLAEAQQWNSSGKRPDCISWGKVHAGEKEPLHDGEAPTQGWVLLIAPFPI